MSVADAGVAAPAEHPPSVFVYSALLDVCAKAGAEEESVRIMRMMKSDKVQPNVVSYSAYLSMFATIGARGDRKAPYKAMQALEEMRAAGLVPNEFSYSSAIASCASATTSIGCSPAVDLGCMLLAAMQRDGIEVTAVPYNTLLHGCARAVESDAAAMDLCWQLFGEMQERGIPMTVVTYTTLIDAGARARDERILERGMQLLQQMADQRLAPNVVTFNAMFKAYATAARAAIDEGRAGAGPRRAVGARGVDGRGRGRGTRRARAAGLAGAGYPQAQGARANARKKRAKQMLDAAMALLEEMRSMGLEPDVYSFNTLLSACACAAAEGRKAPKRGLRALELMQQANLQPSAQSFNQLLEACSLAEEAGAKDGIEIGLRVRALLWSVGERSQSQDSFVDSFVTPRAGGDAEGNVWAEQVIVDAGATWREAVLSHPNAVTDDGLIDAAATARLFRQAQALSRPSPQRAPGVARGDDDTALRDFQVLPAADGARGRGDGAGEAAVVDPGLAEAASGEGANGRTRAGGDDVFLRAIAAGYRNYQNVVAKLVDASATASRIRALGEACARK